METTLFYIILLFFIGGYCNPRFSDDEDFSGDYSGSGDDIYSGDDLIIYSGDCSGDGIGSGDDMGSGDDLIIHRGNCKHNGGGMGSGDGIYSGTTIKATATEKSNKRPSGTTESDFEFEKVTEKPEPTFSGGDNIYNGNKKPNEEYIFKNLNLSAKVGEDISIPCGINPSTVRGIAQWYKNRKPLLEDGNHIIKEPDRVLIRNVIVNDTGNYTCVIWYSHKEEKQEITHTLTVLYSSTITSIEAPGTNHFGVKLIDHRYPISLKCNAFGHPVPEISWYKNGFKLYQTQDDMKRGVYHIDAPNKFDSGNYTCSAYNGIGPPAHADIAIKIRYSPEITIIKPIIQATKDKTSELQCEVDAYPKEVVIWRKKDTWENIQNEARIQLSVDGSIHKLKIKNVQASDLGNYTCVAFNALGSVEKDIELIGKPEIAKLEKIKYYYKPKYSVMLIWSVESLSPLLEYIIYFKEFETYQWSSISGEPSRDSQNDRYIIEYTFKNLYPTDYEVKLETRNIFGWSDSSEIEKFRAPRPSGYYEENDGSADLSKLSMITILIVVFINVFF